MRQTLILSPIFQDRIEKPLLDSYYSDDFIFALMKDEETENDQGIVIGYLIAS